MRKQIGLPILFVLASTSIAVENSSDCKNCETARNALAAAVANPADEAALDAFVASLIETPKGSGVYAVEGDLRMTREQIRAYLAKSTKPAKDEAQSAELIVNVIGGQLDYWRTRSDRHLSYSFDTASFPTTQDVTFTREHLAAAARDWEAACSACGIKFADLTDTAADAEKTTFRVKFSLQDSLIAQSFFPSDAPADRILYVYPQFFQNTGFNPTGVMRHELGHVLGYRHEHIQNIPGCAVEDGDWKMITPYTPNSVMHYFCGGKGSLDLTLREQDKKGHKCLYMSGKPCPKESPSHHT